MFLAILLCFNLCSLLTSTSSQGLSSSCPPGAREKREFSLAPGGGKMRDPGNEVVLTYATAHLGIVRKTRVSSTNTNRK